MGAEAVQVMVELKANPTTINNKKQSALSLASFNEHENVVDYLQTLEPVLQVVQLQGLATQARMIRNERIRAHQEMLEFELAMKKKEEERARKAAAEQEEDGEE